METEVSIDKLVIMANDTPMFRHYIKESTYIVYGGSSKNWGFRHCYHALDGSYIDHSDKGMVRIEFNPNKANMGMIEEMVRTIRYPRLTRMDIAVDYFGVKFNEFEWTSSKAIMETEIKKYGRLETLYLGSWSSVRMYRIYDKNKERKDKDGIPDPRAVNGHWRVEIEQSFSENETAMFDYADYFKDDYFSDIIVHQKLLDLSFIESPTERIMVRGLLADPALIETLGKNAQAKYNKLIREAKERGKADIIHPAEVYKKEKSRLVGKLSELLKKTISYV